MSGEAHRGSLWSSLEVADLWSFILTSAGKERGRLSTTLGFEHAAGQTAFSLIRK
jgi:hypothetical protein